MAMLSATGITVEFGGFRALDDMSLSLESGSILGLVGPNGAGKSTMFNCLTGIVRPGVGQVILDDTDISQWSVHRRARAGIGRAFQTPRVDLDATVLEAVLAGVGPRAHETLLGALLGSPWVLRQEKRFRQDVRQLLERLNLGDGRQIAGTLPAAHLRLLEVARVLAGDARYVLLDEPAAGMDESDRAVLANTLRGLAQQGIGVLIVEHNFPFILSLCDRILVLSSGTVIADGNPQEIRANRQIAKIYLGQAI